MGDVEGDVDAGADAAARDGRGARGRRRSGLVALVAAAIAVPIIAAGWWLGSPLFLDREVDEAFPLSADAAVPDGMTQDEVEGEMADAAATDVPADEPMDEAMAAGEVLASGAFEGADEFHTGTGTATLYELTDGRRILRFEGFEVTNGPDLRVYLTPDGTDVAAGVELGRLKGNVGNQNYDVPADLDVGLPLTVVIWCQPFRVLFASAELAAP